MRSECGSHSYWLAIFCTTSTSPVLTREIAKYLKFLEKNTIFNEHPEITSNCLTSVPTLTFFTLTYLVPEIEDGGAGEDEAEQVVGVHPGSTFPDGAKKKTVC